ncbi:hypothetical protein ACF3NX_14485 (plasmid) [Acetobacter orientalis]|uniref:hypothetical protein n=1 Tax=Acetobacter orientalis TaxID=146474 RepID=UPI00386A8619
MNECEMDSYKLPAFGEIHFDSETSLYNACVGDNGVVDSKQYYDGYIHSAIKLMEVIFNCEEKEGSECQYWIDTFIYPICFNIRHAIEILLKRISETIIAISTARKRIEDISNIEKNISHHDLKLIWNGMKNIAISNDERYRYLLEKIEPFILEIGKIDPTGQTFRYAYSTESVKHLKDVGIIKITRLYNNTQILQSDMKNLFELNDEIYDEYRLGTFTKNMSRHQLIELAEDLPNKENWANELNKELKNRLMLKYNISSNELTKSIKLISNHYEMSFYIGHEIPLNELDSECLFEFLDLWLKNDRVISMYDYTVSCKFKKNDLEKTLYSRESAPSFFNPKFISCLHALYYYAREGDGSEFYIYRQNKKYDEYTSDETGWEMNRDIEHILYYKVDVIKEIIRSLKMLNQPTLIESLSTRYKWTNII